MTARSVLVVDDDPDMRLSLKLALDLAGYSASLAANGREAIELQKQHPADIVITDIFMPEADGFEIIDILRRQFPRTKIVVMSGAGKLAKREYLSTAAIIGVDATVQKPFDVEALLDTLRSL
jgi:CheY-like chemotaxis protein